METKNQRKHLNTRENLEFQQPDPKKGNLYVNINDFFKMSYYN